MDSSQIEKDFGNVVENAAWASRIDTILGLAGRGRKKIVIAGGGASLERLKGWVPDGDTLVVANQSSAPYLIWAGVPVDIIVICDGNEKAVERLAPIMGTREATRAKWVVASKIHPQLWRMLLVHHMYFYHAILVGGNEGDAVYNAAVKAMFGGRTVPFIAQAGSVVNASVILAEWMRKPGQRMEVYFAGVDFGYPEWPRMRVPKVVKVEGELALKEEKEEVEVLEEHPYRTSQVHKIYLGQNRDVRKLMPKEMTFKTMTGGVLEMEMEAGWPN